MLLTADEEQTYYDLTLDRDPQVQRAVELASSITYAQATGQPSSSGSQPAQPGPAGSGPASSQPEQDIDNDEGGEGE